MNLLRLLFVVLTLVLHAGAQSHLFTGIMRTSHGLNNSGDVPYYPESTMTISIPAGSSEVILTFDKPPRFRIPWGYAPVTVMGSTSFADNCSPDRDQVLYVDLEEDPNCGKFMVTDLGNGKAEIKASREWLLGVVQILYDIKVRYETCQKTRGEVDTFYPDQPGRRCPSRIDAITGSQKPHLAVSPPWDTLMVTVQISYLQGIGGSFDFLADTDWIRWMGCGTRVATPETIETYLPDEHCPKEEQYGELERMYEWVETMIESPESEGVEEEACSCEGG